MIAFVDSYVETSDNGDISLAWDRVLASGAHLVVFTPGSTYGTSKPLALTRRLVVLGFLTTIMGWLVVEAGAARSVIAGIEARGTQAVPMSGFLLRARAFLLGCTATKCGRDGFEVDGVNGNANCGVMVGCLSTGHTGRGYSWRGADGNAWTVLGCSTSNCFGEIEEDGQIVRRPAGFDDRSFLGAFLFGCHSGNHTGGLVPSPNAKPLGVGIESDSGGGCWIAGYQETSHQVRVMAPGFAAGGIYELSPDSTAAQIGGSKNGAAWLGRVAFGQRDGVAARLTFGAPGKLGAVAELSRGVGAAAGAFFSLVSQAPWWVVRWRNAKDVIALREDVPEVHFPHGVVLGKGGVIGSDVLDSARLASIEARLAALESHGH